MNNSNNFKNNESELMEYYGYKGNIGKIKLRLKFLKSWILHSLAYSSPSSKFCNKTSTFSWCKNWKELSFFTLCFN